MKRRAKGEIEMATFRLASVIAYGVLVASMVALLLRDSLFAIEFVGISVQGLAALLMLWARLTFGKRSFHLTANPSEGEMVTSGPYRFLRHPIYASIFYFLWAAVCSHLSLLNFLLGLIATAALAVRIAAEEQFLIKHYPEYADYAVRTKRIIPFLL